MAMLNKLTLAAAFVVAASMQALGQVGPYPVPMRDLPGDAEIEAVVPPPPPPPAPAHRIHHYGRRHHFEHTSAVRYNYYYPGYIWAGNVYQGWQYPYYGYPNCGYPFEPSCTR